MTTNLTKLVSAGAYSYMLWEAARPDISTPRRLNNLRELSSCAYHDATGHSLGIPREVSTGLYIADDVVTGTIHDPCVFSQDVMHALTTPLGDKIADSLPFPLSDATLFGASLGVHDLALGSQFIRNTLHEFSDRPLALTDFIAAPLAISAASNFAIPFIKGGIDTLGHTARYITQGFMR